MGKVTIITVKQTGTGLARIQQTRFPFLADVKLSQALAARCLPPDSVLVKESCFLKSIAYCGTF